MSPDQNRHGCGDEWHGRSPAAPKSVRQRHEETCCERSHDRDWPKPQPEERRGSRPTDQKIANANDGNGTPTNRHDQGEIDQQVAGTLTIPLDQHARKAT